MNARRGYYWVYRSIASVLVLSILVGYIPQTYASASSSRYDDRPQLDSLRLSNLKPVLALLKTSPRGHRIVVHIQDVHRNLEAQRNIAQIIRTLVVRHRVDLLALEGAWGPLNVSPVRNHPDLNAVRAASDWLLTQNEISGPIHEAFTYQGAIPFPPLIGVDDRFHYIANVLAYRDAAKRAETMKQHLRLEIAKWTRRRSDIFNSKLMVWSVIEQQYREHFISLGVYIRLLGMQARKLALPLSPNSRALIATFELQSKLKLLLEKNDGSESMRKTIELVGIAYLRNVDRCRKLGPDALMSEIDQLSEMVGNRVTDSTAQMALRRKIRLLGLEQKLVGLALTKREWESYRQFSKAEKLKELAPYETFYVEALARDRAMAENLQLAMLQTDAGICVLVTGGFHSDGISRALQRAGIDVVSITPTFTSVQNGTSYLNAFLQQKTSLQKFFSGERSFLAGPPLANIRSTLELIHAIHNAKTSGDGIGIVRVASDHTLEVRLSGMTVKQVNMHLESAYEGGVLPRTINDSKPDSPQSAPLPLLYENSHNAEAYYDSVFKYLPDAVRAIAGDSVRAQIFLEEFNRFVVVPIIDAFIARNEGASIYNLPSKKNPTNPVFDSPGYQNVRADLLPAMTISTIGIYSLTSSAIGFYLIADLAMRLYDLRFYFRDGDSTLRNNIYLAMQTYRDAQQTILNRIHAHAFFLNSPEVSDDDNFAHYRRLNFPRVTVGNGLIAHDLRSALAIDQIEMFEFAEGLLVNVPERIMVMAPRFSDRINQFVSISWRFHGANFSMNCLITCIGCSFLALKTNGELYDGYAHVRLTYSFEPVFQQFEELIRVFKQQQIVSATMSICINLAEFPENVEQFQRKVKSMAAENGVMLRFQDPQFRRRNGTDRALPIYENGRVRYQITDFQGKEPIYLAPIQLSIEPIDELQKNGEIRHIREGA